MPAAIIDTFADLLHQALQILGPLPLDYEVHDGPGVPLHAHVCARYFPYSNVGGTLNLPSRSHPESAAANGILNLRSPARASD